MYRDNTLIPSEAIRLLALGILANGERRYAELASEVRYFASHIAGPSLELVASPLELLKVEGLIEAADGADHGDPGRESEAPLRITEAGRAELIKLMTSNVRPAITDTNKLVIALKIRFLHLLEPKDQRLQAEIMAETCQRELARLIELRGHNAGEPGHLLSWLDHDIAEIGSRLAWFQALRASLDGGDGA